MAELPNKAKDVFIEKFDGVFGRFKTTESFELAYLQTSLRVSQLAKLVTASDAFDFKSITFEEVVQRDIDIKRVDEEIIEKYLEKGKDRVIFFPPLLVSLVAFDGAKRTDVYRQVDSSYDPETNMFHRTWDKNKFRLELNIAEVATGHELTHEGKNLAYIPYAATLAINPDSVKLVVIDGQHRFTALKRIWDNPKKRHLLDGMELPLCIFFTPDALESNGNVESIIQDLRDLFVTVNTTSKEVSGHFTVLLNDRRLSSLAGMSLANLWKTNSDADAVDALLPLLEWNTRDAKKANQRLKKYSITTISVLADCLQKSILEKPAMVYALLCLSSVAPEFEKTSGPSYMAICEDTFSIDQANILKEQIRLHLTPAVNILLTRLRPYSDAVNRFAIEVKELTAKVEQGTPGTKQFRDDILYKFRKTTENDINSVKDIESQFDAALTIPDKDQDFFLSVFQSGLFRAWSELCINLTALAELSPKEVAELLVLGLNTELAHAERSHLIRDRSYLQAVLFEGERVLVSESARAQWKSFLLAFLGTKPAIQAIKHYLDATLTGPRATSIHVAAEEINKLARSAITSYAKNIEKAVLTDYEKTWRFKDIDDSDLLFLSARDNKSGKEDEEFHAKLRDLAKPRIDAALTSFSNVLGLSKEELLA